MYIQEIDTEITEAEIDEAIERLVRKWPYRSKILLSPRNCPTAKA